MVTFFAIFGVAYLLFAHWVSYYFLKNRILKSRKWDLNICCGKTDGGGVNVDICKHKEIPNFQIVTDVYNLPFPDKKFKTVLCSHTIEHVDDPERFFHELQRVGKEVTIVLPPLYDIAAALNIFEHKYIFFTLRKKHKKLPRYMKLPFSTFIHKYFGQTNRA